MLKKENYGNAPRIKETPCSPSSPSKSTSTHFRTRIATSIFILCLIAGVVTFLQWPRPKRVESLGNLCEPPQRILLKDRHLRFNFLNAYVRKHHEQRACLVSKSCFPKPKVLIWQCPTRAPSGCAGLGDRIRGIQFTFLLAVATNRLFFLSWPSEPYPLLSALQPNLIDWRVPKELGGPEERPELNWLFCHGNRSCEARHRPNLTSLPAIDEHQQDVNIFETDIEDSFARHDVIGIITRIGNTMLPLFLRNPNILKNLEPLHDSQIVPLVRDVFSALFRASPSVERVIQLHSLSFDGPHVSIHARTGLDVNEGTNERFQYINGHLRDSAQQLISCAQSMVQSIPKHIFVAADSQEIKEYLAEEAKIQGANVKFIPDKALHLGINLRQTEEMEKVQKCKAFMNIFADLVMVARGQGIVATGSGFANVAYILGSSERFTEVKLDGTGDVKSQCQPSERDAGWRLFFF